MTISVKQLETKRYTDCKTLDELTKMLDDKTFRDRLNNDLNYPYASFPRAVTGLPYAGETDSGIRFGTLARLIAEKNIQRADSTGKLEANGIVIAVTGANQFIWSPEAIVKIPVGGTFNRSGQQVFLGPNGMPTFESPTSGFSQRCGIGLYYDSSVKQYVCHIRCDVGFYL